MNHLRRLRCALSTLVVWAWSMAAGRAATDATAVAHAAPARLASATHWAYAPLQRPDVPKGSLGTHPVDAFIEARLATVGLHRSPEAERRDLIRRVTFDLTGLPPTPEEITAFLADERPGAYERVVERLLASPRYGERWARHWMDVAHFAETHGHDQDRIRTNAWPYRDYLVTSFNQDKPYARFVEEQVAGDVLWPEDPAANAALGFVSAGPWDESSLRDIREDTLDRQIGRYLDRDDMVTTVMQTFVSTTVQCARCHDHKFDPVTQADYYSLQAVFAGVDRGNKLWDADPAQYRRRRELMRAMSALERDDAAVQAELDSPAVAAEVAAWETRLQTQRIHWMPLLPSAMASAEGATLLLRESDGSILSTGDCPATDSVTVCALVAAGRVSALRLEVLPDPSLPHQGPGRAENGNLHLSEIELWAAPAQGGEYRRLALSKATASFNQEGWGIHRALDGDPRTAWGIHPAEGQAHRAAFELQTPLDFPEPTVLQVVLHQWHGGQHLLGRFRLSFTDHAPPIDLTSFPTNITEILEKPATQRRPEERRALARFHRRRSLESQLAALPPPTFVYAAANDFLPDGSHRPAQAPRPIRILRRGEITKPAEAVGPGTLACLAGLPARFAVADSAPEGTRRVALARWLTAPHNALTWRSIVNRTWQQHFGRGLVETPNDFGQMGARPSHPDLLDWLAVWFRDEAHGSLKHLHRLLVTSATYRQRVNALPTDDPRTLAARAEDQDNRLYWRMNRLRLDAEQIRDAILAVSGRLDFRMGGPSDQQFDLQPGLHVTPRVDYLKFDPDAPEGRRRSTYRFLFRTLPDPFMDALDCPAGDQLTPVRSASVTVQQALALWNNAFVNRYAERFAQRLSATRPSSRESIQAACELALGRPPRPEEAEAFTTYVQEHGLANLARLLFNTNEFLFLN